VIRFEPADVESGDGQRLEAAMREEMRELYGGLDLRAEGMPKAGREELSPPGGMFLVGYEDELAVCCGGFKRLSADVCELKRMYVVPQRRGCGIARALLAELEERARRFGYSVARLDTGPKQPAARHLYESAGYLPIGNFNASPVATYFGEKRL